MRYRLDHRYMIEIHKKLGFWEDVGDGELPPSEMLRKVMGWMRSARQREKFSKGAVCSLPHGRQLVGSPWRTTREGRCLSCVSLDASC